jgi:DNA modification methylase
MSAAHLSYENFLQGKIRVASQLGFELNPLDVNPLLKPHQRDIVLWALAGGRRAIFAAFGLGKSFIQLEIARLLQKLVGGRFLIVAPLGVRMEFLKDAAKLGISIRFVRSIDECDATGIYLTNYETIRDGKLNPKEFTAASLDEASCLRGFGGTKTFREFMRLFDGMKYKFVATATPSPNEYIELLAYSAFLEVMEVGEAKTRFFKRNSEKADQLTIHPHKQYEFWLWCASWAMFLQRPSDLGYSDEGYSLPEIEIHWHEIPSDHANAGEEVNGQGRLLKHAAIGIVHASREKRDSLPGRIEKLLELRSIDPSAHRIIWHDLESERRAIEAAIPDITTVWGTQDMEQRERAISDFSEGLIPELATKPVIAGSGCNFQTHCAWEIFLGIGFKFNDFIQAIHRVQRFLQTRPVRIDLIYTEAEREVRRILEQKWEQHNRLMQEMSNIIQKYGMAQASLSTLLQRSIGVERIEVTGAGWRLVNNDCVLETHGMAENSVHLVVTSIPFSTQYEYTPSYLDFGHTDSNQHFWQQMDYLTPELLRVLKPGRLAAIHVKDRIVPGGMTKLGFQTVYPFHVDCIQHFQKHGFAFMGMKTIVTDVVRENNQTYRLGWSEQCKDGSKMGFGMPEYLLLFRKAPSDTSNSYADEMVAKEKPLCVTPEGNLVPFDRNLPIKPGTGYSRARWQFDAHGFSRSSGNRTIKPEEFVGLKHDQIFKLFREYSANNIYDYEHHIRLGESLEAEMRLPVTFMLLQPQSWHDDVWTDITRMLTLNGAQSAAGREMHLCPLQFDIVDRAIAQYTMRGEVVYDPFAGLGTVPYRAVLLGREGWGTELNARYFFDSVQYLKAAEQKVSMPTLFDLEEELCGTEVSA